MGFDEMMSLNVPTVNPLTLKSGVGTGGTKHTFRPTRDPRLAGQGKEGLKSF